MFKTLLLTSVLLTSVMSPLAQSHIAVGIDRDFEPFSYLEKASYTGFSIDILDALAKAMGEEYTIHPMAAQELIPSLEQHKLEAAFMTDACGCNNSVVLSEPYFKAGQRIMVHYGRTDIFTIADLDGHSVGTKFGSQASSLLYDLAPKAMVSLFPRIQDAYDELQRDGIDAVFFDTVALSRYANGPGDAKVKVVGPVYGIKPYSVALPEQSPLLARFNKALEAIRADGTYTIIYEKWFGPMP